MVFNSYEFTLAFLPLVAIVTALVRRLKKPTVSVLTLLAFSLVFYILGEPKDLVYLTFFVLLNYLAYRMVPKNKPVLVVSIVLNVLALFYFRYLNFTLDLIGLDFRVEDILVPLGISYITFQAIALLVDTYKEKEWTEKITLAEFALYITYFPKILAGPIVLPKDFIPQLKSESILKVTSEDISQGLYLFAMGMGKKVLIAETFAKVANTGFGLEGMNTTSTVLTVLAYSFQIYFDFSGYSDMGMGISKILGIDLPLNFNSPYKSLDILDFWKRWHLSLTTFFTTYVYFPLGGNRKGKARQYFNIMVVFLLSGIWHGPSLTYLFWGALNGILSTLNRIALPLVEKIWKPVRWAITFALVNLSWIFFRADSIGSAFTMIKNIFRFNFGGIDTSLMAFVNDSFGFVNVPANLLPIVTLAIFLVVLVATVLLKNVYEKSKEGNLTLVRAFVTAFVLALSILHFNSVTAFIYAGF